MADQQPAKAYVVAMVFGSGDTQQIVAQAVLAPSSETATALAVSAAHVYGKVILPCTGIHVDELQADFIERARRGFVGDAPVVSLVPQSLGTPNYSETHDFAGRHNAAGQWERYCKRCNHTQYEIDVAMLRCPGNSQLDYENMSTQEVAQHLTPPDGAA